MSSKFDIRTSLFDAANCNDEVANTICHTAYLQLVWLKLDMFDSFIISSIKIHNRIGVFDRISGFKLFVGHFDERNIKSNDFYADALTSHVSVYRNNSQVFAGRYFFIYYNGEEKKILNLDEVYVYTLQLTL